MLLVLAIKAGGPMPHFPGYCEIVPEAVGVLIVAHRKDGLAGPDGEICVVGPVDPAHPENGTKVMNVTRNWSETFLEVPYRTPRGE
jgi:hypothetical protein